jgi:hypothetical protein
MAAGATSATGGTGAGGGAAAAGNEPSPPPQAVTSRDAVNVAPNSAVNEVLDFMFVSINARAGAWPQGETPIELKLFVYMNQIK